MAKPPKPKGARSTSPTTPKVEEMHARIVSKAATVKMQVRVSEDLRDEFKIVAITKKTTPENLLIALMTKAVADAAGED